MIDYSLDNAINTHDLLIKVLMAEAGLLGAPPADPNSVTNSVALGLKRISDMIAGDWDDKNNVIQYPAGESNKLIAFRINKKQDSRLMLVLHQHLKFLSDTGAQSPVTYLNHAIFPSITYMLSTHRKVRSLIESMLLSETNTAMRKFAAQQIMRITENQVNYNV